MRHITLKQGLKDHIDKLFVLNMLQVKHVIPLKKC